MGLKIVSSVIILFTLVGVVNGVPYKWASTIPVEFVPLSNMDNSKEVDYYLNKPNIVIFYIDDNFKLNDRSKEILRHLNITQDKEPIGVIPDYGNYTFISTNGFFVVYPKKYVYRSENGGALIFNPPKEVNENKDVFEVKNLLLDEKNSIYEIKNKKLFVPYPASLENKKILDFVGQYVAENGGTFAYINKVPPFYKQVVISGVAVQNAIPDPQGDSAISVAGRKITVDVRDEEIINKKINKIKIISKLLNINTTYITTGSENINIIKENRPTNDEIKTLLNDYWFKKCYLGYYSHLHYEPSNLNELTKDFDILAMSYYPLIYVDKAPETFKNDPIGGYYPETISYKGTEEVGYWEKGPKSENNYYHYDGEDYWKDDEKISGDYWSFQGKRVPLRNESDLNDKYRYFNYWFVKNYGYAISQGVNGIILFTNDEDLLDAVFKRDSENIQWKLNIEDLDYIVVPYYSSITEENGVMVINIPGINNNEINGVHFIKEYYLPPKDEEYGVYVADVIEYDINKIYGLKDNYTWICSFNDYANWIKKYKKNSIKILNNSVYLKSKDGVKVTIYKKDMINLGKVSTCPNSSLENYNKEINKIVIANPPRELVLN